ncbi:MAG: cytochrome c [Opitutaceae bacterium]|nr:cytochrome c [Opitutaceae bacterium]
MKISKIFALLSVILPLATGAAYAASASENWDNGCAKCHAADGSGSTKIGKKLKLKDYTDAQVQAGLKDEEMAKAIKEGVTENGKERMKGFKDELSDAEINDLVAYIRALKK